MYGSFNVPVTVNNKSETVSGPIKRSSALLPKS